MKRTSCLSHTCLVLALAACSGPGTEPLPVDESQGQAIASYRHGHIFPTEVEKEVDQKVVLQRVGDRQSQVAEYLRAAKTLVVRQILSAGDGQEGANATEDSEGSKTAEAQDRFRRQAVLSHYFRHQLEVPVAEQSAIEAYYEENRDLLRQPAQRLVWHLFRRHEDPSKPQATSEYLLQLKRRLAEGETFRELASEHSQSETRLFEGRLGRIGKGRLSPAVESVVFSLAEGEVSEPVKVPGGEALFFVTEVLEEKEFSLEDLREQIARRLREQHLASQLAAAVADFAMPTGSRTLNAAELSQEMAEPNPDSVVLRIGSFLLTQNQLRQQVERALARVGLGVSQERLREELYERHVHQQLLYLKLVEEDSWSDSDRQQIGERVERALKEWRVQKLLEARMRQQASEEPEEVRAFYEDNAHRFQSSLALKLQTISLPLGGDLAGTMVAMDRVRNLLVAGDISFEQAANRLGATVTHQGWVDFSALVHSDTKLRTYLLTLGRQEGFTVPFQLNGSLNLIWVESWREPEILPFEEAEEEIREQYFQRNQQRLYQQVVEQVLKGQEFRFHEDVVLSLLSPSSLLPSPVNSESS